MAMIHVNRSGSSLGIFDEERVREGLRTGEFIGTDLGWMEGMATWRPLSELESFGAAPTPPPPQVPAVTVAPQAGAAAAAATTPVATAARTGLPWENRQGRGFFDALIETIGMIFSKPAEAFTIMRREGGFGDPLLYALILGLAGSLISIGFSLGLNSLGIMADRHSGIAALLGLGIGSIFLIFLIPVVIIVGMFIGAAITHVCLMIVGGANQSYETTLRVLCYSQGTANVLQIVPFCGGILAGIAAVIFNCIGLARAHETDTWRAVVAILLPLAVCCGGGVLLFFVLIGSMAGGWH